MNPLFRSLHGGCERESILQELNSSKFGSKENLGSDSKTTDASAPGRSRSRKAYVLRRLFD